MQTAEVTVYGS